MHCLRRDKCNDEEHFIVINSASESKGIVVVGVDFIGVVGVVQRGVCEESCFGCFGCFGSVNEVSLCVNVFVSFWAFA
jgi:hypothetical protein